MADHKTLGAADQARLKQISDQVFQNGRERLLGATGRAYAEQLSVDDLRRLIAFYRTPTAARFQAALPKVIIGTMTNAGHMDFKGDVLKAYCAQTGKLCDEH